MLEKSFLQQDIIIHNVNISNRASNYKSSTLIELQGEREESTFIVSDSNIPLSVTDPAIRKSVEGIAELNSTSNQLDPTEY